MKSRRSALGNSGDTRLSTPGDVTCEGITGTPGYQPQVASSLVSARFLQQKVFDSNSTAVAAF